MRKLVFCVGQLIEPGGTERVLANKVNYLSSIGYEIIIITVNQKQNKYFYNFNSKIKFYDITYEKPKFLIHPFLFIRNIIYFRKEYNKLLKKIQPDIVTVNERGYLDFIIPFISKHIPKIREFHSSQKAIKLHITQMNSIISRLRHKIMYSFLYKIFNKYDYLVLLTKSDYNESDYKTNVEIIPNMHKPIVLQKSKLENKKVISVGSMNGNIKRFDLQIMIWHNIIQKNKDLNDWSLHIYGDGKNRLRLQKKINKLGLEKHIFLHGKSKNLYKHYLDSSIFIFTSIGEGFGMVLVEAMSYGLPCVSFNCPHGPSEIIDNNNDGFLIKNDDIIEFEKKLTLLMKDDKLRKNMGKNAYSNSKRFCPKQIGLKWNDLYNKILKHSKL